LDALEAGGRDGVEFLGQVAAERHGCDRQFHDCSPRGPKQRAQTILHKRDAQNSRPNSRLPDGRPARYDAPRLKSPQTVRPTSSRRSILHRRQRPARGPGVTPVKAIPRGRTTMKHTIRLTLLAGIAAGTWMLVPGDRVLAQGADANAAPNPYK